MTTGGEKIEVCDRPTSDFRCPTLHFKCRRMRLYLLRHAPAIDRQDWAGDDAERPLTADGERLARKLLKNLRTLLRADEILTSPWRRARQTAELAAERFGLPLREADWLAGGAADPEEACSNLTGGDILLVGHEPDLGQLIGHLTGGATVALKKAGLAVLVGEATAGGMALRALLDAKTINRLRD